MGGGYAIRTMAVISNYYLLGYVLGYLLGYVKKGANKNLLGVEKEVDYIRKEFI